MTPELEKLVLETLATCDAAARAKGRSIQPAAAKTLQRWQNEGWNLATELNA